MIVIRYGSAQHLLDKPEANLKRVLLISHWLFLAPDEGFGIDFLQVKRAISLRSLAHGTGSFHREHRGYEQLPDRLAKDHVGERGRHA